MQALRPVLRRRLPTLVRRYPPVRPQQNYGPHKEYFQTPGQAPLPDTTPYNARTPISTQKISAKPSRSWRLVKSLNWAALFTVLGLVAGTALITWEYLQPPFEPGSEEEQELQAEIDEMLDTHSLVHELRSDGWLEENFYDARHPRTTNTSMNMMHEHLTGTQGLTIKAFRHPSKNFTMLVFFTGFGIEGWPDVVHGGVITSMLLEAAMRHHRNYYSDFADRDQAYIHVDFKRPMRPGEVYAVLVPPAAIQALPELPEATILKLVPMLFLLDAAPKLEMEADLRTQTETHHVQIPTAGRTDPTLAIATIQLPVVEKDKRLGSEAIIEKDDQP